MGALHAPLLVGLLLLVFELWVVEVGVGVGFEV